MEVLTLSLNSIRCDCTLQSSVLSCVCVCVCVCVCACKQLFGRAGRGGMPSLAHLFFSSKKQCSDKGMELFQKNSEAGCRRRVLIEGIGGSILPQPDCCDLCSTHPLTGRLNIFSEMDVARKKHRVAVRTVHKDLLVEKLKAVRNDFMKNHPAFKMIGEEFVCPNSTISKVAENSKFITSADDFPIELRVELKDVFIAQ